MQLWLGLHKGGQKKGVGAYTPMFNLLQGQPGVPFPFFCVSRERFQARGIPFPFSVDGICKIRFVIATFPPFRGGLHWVKVDEKAERTGKSSRRAASVGTAATSDAYRPPSKTFTA